MEIIRTLEREIEEAISNNVRRLSREIIQGF